ncbi:MAG: alpha/beta fold hydrolase [Ignavibacteriales bacterium]|nr:alpha/beta fold hydrolase [Ignavibacteriales bacterium]
MNRDFTLIASDGEKLNITTYLNEQLFFGKTIIFVHGFKGFKDWGFGPYLGEYFANKGFFVITFNFSHNGIGDSKFEFTEIEKFEENTFSREVRELNELLDSVRKGFFKKIDPNSKVGLIGHSRGGAVAILSAAKRNDVNAVVTWAAISKLDRYSLRQKNEWRKKGFFEIMNVRTKQMMRLNLSTLDDILQNESSSLNLENALRNLNIPLLIAHGDQDLAVQISEAEMLYDWSDKSKTELFKIFGTGHTFDIVHPFSGTNAKFDKLLEETTKFFIKNLN